MSKITAKHFLNTNLKPYTINGVKHYSIYIMIIAFRQNTKVKSITFNEYYSENDFNELINSKDSFDKELIDNEIHTITEIAKIIIENLKGFDTAFLTSFFKFSATVPLHNFNEYYYLDYKAKDLSYKFDLHDFLKKYDYQYKMLFDFYSLEIQEKLRIFLTESNNNIDVNYLQNLLNEAYFYISLDKFKDFLKNTKTVYLVEKYDTAFNLISTIKQDMDNQLWRRKTKDSDFEKYLE